ncbi:MAG: molybdenum cofactor biosynthesis protein MoaE [Planctomycetaceae bacterium]|nr:molybdenum cofactor biosynthesis protein MoaE [Planctomycetaceae bacterium]
MIRITDHEIDVHEVLRRVRSPQAGAVVLFLGTTREFTHGRRSVSLDYECYPEMAEAELQQLERAARQRWTLVDVCVVHRVGHLELEEIGVAIAVSAAHRQAAFEAGRWLIDRLKQVVPIWKKENYADGTAEWVNPAGEQQDSSPP